MKKLIESIKREPISTGIDDVFPHFEGIEDYPPRPVSSKIMNELAQNGEVILEDGIYDFYLQGFCVDAGKHGPSSDSAYLIAPLKGKRSKNVENILKNSTKHPEIPQHNIQALVWAISSGTKYGEMPRDMQLLANLLLAEEDLKSLGKSLLDRIPKPIRDWLLTELKKRLPKEVLHFLDTLDNIKQKIMDALATYEELERITIRSGRAPIPDNMEKVGAGQWSLVQERRQFFMRFFPETYSRSKIQVYIPMDKDWVELTDQMVKEYGIDE